MMGMGAEVLRYNFRADKKELNIINNKETKIKSNTMNQDISLSLMVDIIPE
jgi:hypothetical protein